MAIDLLKTNNLNKLTAAKGSKYEGYTFEQVKLATVQGKSLPLLYPQNNNLNNGTNNNGNKPLINDPKYNLIKNMTMKELQDLLTIKNTGVNKDLNDKIKQLEELINANNQVNNSLNNIQNPININNDKTGTNNNPNLNQPVNISQDNTNKNNSNNNINKDQIWQIQIDKYKAELTAKENLLKSMENKFNDQNKLIENDIIDNKLREALLKKGCIPESAPLLLRDPNIRSQLKADINTKEVYVLNPDGSDGQLKPEDFVEILKTNFPEYKSAFNTYQGVGNIPGVASGGKDVSNQDAQTRLSWGIHQMMGKNKK